MKRATLGIFAVLAMVFASASFHGCGAAAEAVRANEGASPVRLAEGSVNGKSMKVFVASTVMQRARAEKGIDLRPGSNNVIAMVFGGLEQELVLEPDLAFPADLVFANRAGKVVKTRMGDVEGYVPFALHNVGGNSEVGANIYRSGSPASVALFVPRGDVAKLGVKTGEKISVTPDPFADAEKADPQGISLSFSPEKRPDVDDEPAKPVVVKTRVALTAEDRARNILPGEKSVLILYPTSGKNPLAEGFWLKGVEGKCSLAFLAISAPRSSMHDSFRGQVVDVIEDAEDSVGDDTERRVWWPSKAKTGISSGNRTSDEAVNAILVIRGDHALSALGVAERMFVTSNTALAHQATPYSVDGIEADSLDNLSVRAGEQELGLRVYRGPQAINDAIATVGDMRHSEARVLVWDNTAQATAENRGTHKVSLRLLAHDGGNAFHVSSSVDIDAGKTMAHIDGAVSRFALLCAASADVGAKVTLPWMVANLRPFLLPGAFFGGEAPDKHSCSSPKNSLARVRLEIADTAITIRRGLMFKTSLPKDQGMLFVFDSAETHEFWMKNCEMDIDVAFVDEDFRIVSLHEMKREPAGTPDAQLKLYASKPHRAKYAVEMEGGWFKKNSVARNDFLWIPVTSAQPRGAEK